MTNETLTALREALDYTAEAMDGIKQDKALEPEYKKRYLELLDRALTDLDFIKGHYSLALHLREHPEDGEKILKP